jgi:diadenylate cyclase
MEYVNTFVQQIANMRWSDYLDILIVACLIYTLLPMIRSTGAMRIARVVFAVMVIAWLAVVLKLYTLSWLLNQLLGVGVIAVVVLFQPELRRMLDHLSNVKLKNLFGSTKSSQEMDTVITQTVMACEVMSRERVGALIVFARNMELEDYVKTGTSIDAQVSEQLLRNIFFPKAALHDGAMIIRGGRVTAAGCVLPLSDSKRLSPDLGTRHRAGVGMSEISDAVVVIVSEETGAISVAVGGMLKRHLASQTLERLLRNELLPSENAESETPMMRLRQKLHNKAKGDDKNEK